MEDGTQTDGDLMSEIQKLKRELLEKQKEHNDAVMEKIQSIKKELSVETDLETSQHSRPFNDNSGKEFHLVYIFNNISGIKEKESRQSDTDEYFNVPWKMSITKDEERLGFYLHCEKPKNSVEKWSIETEYDFKLKYHHGGSVTIRKFDRMFESIAEKNEWGSKECKEWQKVLEEFVHDDKLIVEAHVKINKMDGCYKKNEKTSNRDFKDPKFSDVVLVVGEEKFYVPKLFLASRSTYFESLFLGNFTESQMTEIPLANIDPDDFQNFLELLYGESCANEDTVEGILRLADMYDARIAVERCEQFLIGESKKSLKKKIQMSTRYNLAELKKHSLASVKTVDDIKGVLFSDRSQMDQSIVATLLDKSLALATSSSSTA